MPSLRLERQQLRLLVVYLKALAPTNSSKCWVGSVSTWIKRIARALRNQELLKATLRWSPVTEMNSLSATSPSLWRTLNMLCLTCVKHTEACLYSCLAASKSTSNTCPCLCQSWLKASQMKSTKWEKSQCVMLRFALSSSLRTPQCSSSNPWWRWCSALIGRSVRALPSWCSNSLRSSRMTSSRLPQPTLTRKPSREFSAVCSSSNTTPSRRSTLRRVKFGRVWLTIKQSFLELWLTAASKWSSRLSRVTPVSSKTWVLLALEVSSRRWERNLSSESLKSSMNCSKSQLSRSNRLVCADFCTVLLALHITDSCRLSAPSLFRSWIPTWALKTMNWELSHARCSLRSSNVNLRRLSLTQSWIIPCSLSLRPLPWRRMRLRHRDSSTRLSLWCRTLLVWRSRTAC